MTTFTKAILGHIFSDFEGDIESFNNWDKEHDIKHKVNLLYAAMLGLLGVSLLLYTQLWQIAANIGLAT